MYSYKVAATTANIGPGFDCMGICLDMYNTVRMEEIPSGLEITVSGRDADKIPTDDTNYAYKMANTFFEETGYPPKGLKIILENEIPIARGLGSSASIVLGAFLCANDIAKTNLDRNQILYLATKIEGHPDNVAPAMFGGFVAGSFDAKTAEFTYKKLDVSSEITCIAMIPNYPVSTPAARNLLPDVYSRQDAISNVANAVLVALAFAKSDFSLLKKALKDNFHEPYRKKLIKEYDFFNQISAKNNTLGTYISGSGSTMISFCKKEKAAKFLKNLEDAFETANYKCEFKLLNIDNHGTYKID